MNNVNIPAKTAYHHGNLKPALIAAAAKEIARDGLDGFSLRGVARRAGVSAPAVYNHFESKEDLLAAVAADTAAKLSAMIAEAQAAAPEHPLEQFRAVGISIVRFATANPEHFRVMCMPGFADRKPSADEGIAKLRAAQAAGLIATVPIDDLVLAANALVTGLAHLIVEGQLGEVDDKRATELAIAVTAVLGVGLIPRDEDIPDPFSGASIKGRKQR